MLEPISPAWRRVVSLLFAAGTIGAAARYLAYAERFPNYLRVLGWFADWWR